MMDIRPLIFALILTLAASANQASAQSRQAGRVEVVGVAALHKLWDDESSIGTGISGGGGVGVALSDTLKIRGRIVRFSNGRDFDSGVIFNAIGTRYTADLIWQPFTASHAPYFGVGGGGFSYTRSSQYPAGSPQMFTRSDTDLIFGGLAGFSAVTSDRFRLGPEASLWWSRPGYFIGIEVGILAAWRF